MICPTSQARSYSPKRGGTAVFDPKFVTEGGRLFVRGTIPHNTTPNDWSGGAATGIAWEHVVEYTVFDSVEDYLRRIAPFTEAEPVQ